MLLKIIMLLQNFIALLIIAEPMIFLIFLIKVNFFPSSLTKEIEPKKMIIKSPASCGKPVMNIMIETDAKEWEEYGL